MNLDVKGMTVENLEIIQKQILDELNERQETITLESPQAADLKRRFDEIRKQFYTLHRKTEVVEFVVKVKRFYNLPHHESPYRIRIPFLGDIDRGMAVEVSINSKKGVIENQDTLCGLIQGHFESDECGDLGEALTKLAKEFANLRGETYDFQNHSYLTMRDIDDFLESIPVKEAKKIKTDLRPAKEFARAFKATKGKKNARSRKLR
jgi:hypothetical protein